MAPQRPSSGHTHLALAQEELSIVDNEANPDESLRVARPIPTAVTICGGCGAIYQHAVLALLNRPAARPAIEDPKGPRLVVP